MTKDQKRAAAVAAAGGGGLFLLYRHQNKNAQTGHGPPPVTNAGAFGQVAPYTPQDPVTLEPGQSVYDPNSEGLVNTPTSGPPTFGDSPDFFGSGAWQSQGGGGATAAPTSPTYNIHVGYGHKRPKPPGRRHGHPQGPPNHPFGAQGHQRHPRHRHKKHRKVTHG